MSLQEPSPSIPNPQPLARPDKEEEEKKKPEEEEEEDTEEEDKLKKGKDKGKSKKAAPGSPKGRISVTMYGAISGDEKCPYCTNAHKFFRNPAQWKKYHYTHVDIFSDKAMKVAEKKGFDKMPFFRVRMPGETRDEWVEGLNALNELIGTDLR